MSNALLTDDDHDVDEADPAMEPPEIFGWLKAQTLQLLADVQREPMWRALTAPDADPAFVRRMMGEV